MSAIKDGRIPLVLGGKQRHIILSLDVLDEIQDRLGDLDGLDDLLHKPKPRDLKWLLSVMLKGAADEGEETPTEQQLGRMIHTGNLQRVRRAIDEAVMLGSAGDEDVEEDKDDEGSEKN